MQWVKKSTRYVRKRLFLIASFGFALAVSVLFILSSQSGPAAHAARTCTSVPSSFGGGGVGQSQSELKANQYDLCIGEYYGKAGASQLSGFFSDIVITFESAVAKPTIELTSSPINGTPAPFQSGSDLFVPADATNKIWHLNPAVAEGFGYFVNNIAGNRSLCAASGTGGTINDTDVGQNASIKVSANGTSYSQTLNMCASFFDESYTVAVAPTGIKGDGGEASVKGSIRGWFQVVREKDTANPGKANSTDITEIILKKRNASGTFEDFQSSTSLTPKPTDGWFSFNLGELNIGNLDPGTYSLSFKYDDRTSFLRENPGGSYETVGNPANSCVAYSNSRINVEAGRPFVLEISSATSYSNLTPVTFEECGTTVVGNPDVAVESKPACTADGVFGWLLCGLFKGIQGAMSFLITNVFEPLLTVNFFTQQNQPIFLVWQNIRNAANVLFIVAFFAVIISQATSIGISSYGIKKMLPKIIAAAIMINLSYWICAAATDLFNVLGRGAFDLIGGATAGITPNFEVGTGTSLLAGALVIGAGAAIIAGPGFAAIAWAIVPIFLTAGALLLIVVLALVARMIAIALLIAVSPLAIAAFIFPGTESWFEKWRKAFVSLLVVFPVVMLLLGSGNIAAVIISGLANGDTGAVGLFWQILAVIASILPIVAIWPILKASSGVLRRFGVYANNAQKGLLDRGNKWAKDRSGDAKNRQGARGLNGGYRGSFARGANRREVIRGGAKTELDRARAGYIGDRLTDNQRFQRQVAQVGLFGVHDNGSAAAGDAIGRAQGQGQAVKAKLDKEVFENAMHEIEHSIVRNNGAYARNAAGVMQKVSKDEALEQLAKGQTIYHDASGGHAFLNNSAMSDAAINKLAKDGRSNSIRKLQNHAATTSNTEMSQDITSAIASNAGSLVGKAPDLVKGLSGAFDNPTGAAMGSFSADTVSQQIQYMQGLQNESVGATGTNVANLRAQHAQAVIDYGATDSRTVALDTQATDAATAAGNKFSVATASFNQSLENIRDTASLRSGFSPEVARQIQTSLADPANTNVATSVGGTVSTIFNADGTFN